MKRVRQALRKIREAGRQVSEHLDQSDYCWPCSMGRCGPYAFVNTCRCCRSNHTR